MKVYLKTILTSEAEYPFIAAQYLELSHLIDRILVIEPGFTHTGQERNRVGVAKLLNAIPEMARKLEYLPLPMTAEVIPNASNNEHACHKNERITRGLFSRFIDLDVRDIIISTDADEVMYSSVVEKSLDRISSKFYAWRAESFYLHQFMYLDTLIAQNFRFTGPSIIGAGRYFLTNRPMQWRYAGKLQPFSSGCHFSWCFPVNDLVQKVKTFAHAPSYLKSGVSPKKLIEDDILNRVYSFRNPPIHLEEVENPEAIWPNGYIEARSLNFGSCNE